MAGHLARRMIAVVLLLSAPVAFADEVPQKLALTVMLKVLTYDQEFARHGTGDFVVFVVGEPEAVAPVLEAADQIEQKTISGRKLVFVQVSASDVTAKLARASALLAPLGTGNAVARELAKVAAASKLYSLTLDPKLVEQGITLGVGLAGNKPQPLINVTAARACGVDFKPSVLKIAHTVQ